MKRFLTTLGGVILGALLVMGAVKTEAAIGVGWTATSTDFGFISPTSINGNIPFLKIPYFYATSTTATSTIANLGGTLDANQFPGSDIGAKINAAYAALPATGGIITIEPGTFTQTTRININTSGKTATIIGAGANSTIINSTVVATSSVWNAEPAGSHTANWGFKNLTYNGPATAINDASVAIEVGGNIGGQGWTGDGLKLNNWGTGVYSGANTYQTLFENSFVSNGTKEYYVAGATNSGESLRFAYDSFTDSYGANGTFLQAQTDACVTFNINGAASAVFTGVSFDDCALVNNDGNLNLTLVEPHFENPGVASGGTKRYTYFTNLGTNGFNRANIMGGTIMNDASTTQYTPNQYILNSGLVSLHGTTFNGNSTGQAAAAVNNFGSNGKLEIFGSSNIGNPAYAVMATSSINFQVDSQNSLITANIPFGPISVGKGGTFPFLTVGTTTSGMSGVDAEYIAANKASDAQFTLNNLTAGFGSYLRAIANSNYVSFETIGTNADWKFGEFGTGSFSFYDSTNNKTPVLFSLNAPTDSIHLSSSGNVGIGTANPLALLTVNGLASTTNLTISGISGSTQCLHVSSTGVVSGTGSDCGAGGTNFWTSLGGNIYNNTGALVQAPAFSATSTTATSTFAGDVWIGSSGVLPNPDLRIGTSSLPLYQRVLGDVIDAEYDYNGVSSINVANANIGNCAAATYFADGNNPTLGGYFGTFSFLNDGWTNGGGAGCGIGVSNTDKPEAVAIASPTGEMDFDIASTTNTGAADFNWNVNNILRMKLTNGGNLGIGSTSPVAVLSVVGQSATNGVQLFNAPLISTGANNFFIFGATIGGVSNVLNNFNNNIGLVIKKTSTGTGDYLDIQNSSAVSQFKVLSNGNVGIATSTPSQALSVAGTLYALNYDLYGVTTTGVTGTGNMVLSAAPTFSGVVVGTTFTASAALRGGANATANMTIQGTTNASPTTGGNISFQPTNSVTAVTIASTSFMGVGTTSPWRTLAVTGTVGLDGLTTSASTQSGVLCISANKEVINDSVTCIASARRFKQDINPLSATSSLAELMMINPVTYFYKPNYNGPLQSNPNFNGEFKGFIADDVGKIDPTLIEIETATSSQAGINSYPGQAAGLKIDNIVAVLWSATQQIANHQSVQDQEIAQLQVEITQLKSQQPLAMCKF